MRVHAFPHDALKTHTSTHKTKRSVCACVCPRRGAAVSRDAALPTLPERNCGSHCEEGLNKGAENEPGSGLGTDAIADASEEGAEEEGENGGERLSVGDMKAPVVFGRE